MVLTANMQRTATSLPFTELDVAVGNFDTIRSPITTIVLHTMVGTWQSAAARFANASSGVSAHYGVKMDGSLIHWLEEYLSAYHAGNLGVNRQSIGVEHEDLGNYNSPRPDALYEGSAKLVADICKFYSIPCDKNHIIRHHDVPGASTACPDSLDTDRIINRAAQLISGSPMDANIVRKSSFFDRIWLAYAGNTDTNVVTSQQVDGFNANVKSNRDRAGSWDLLCRQAGFTGDTNQITHDQLFNKIKSMALDESSVRTDERAKTITRAKSLLDTLA